MPTVLPMSETHRALRGTQGHPPRRSRALAARRGHDARRSSRATVSARSARRSSRRPSCSRARSVQSTDIVRKEMYTFERRAGVDLRCGRRTRRRSCARSSSTRCTAASRRGYPERYFYIGPMFRHERPQKGRQRQFHQIGAEVLGAAEPLCDAETIEMVVALARRRWALRDRELLLNSVGDARVPPALPRRRCEAWLAAAGSTACARTASGATRRTRCASSTARSRPIEQLLAGRADVLDGPLCDPCAAHFAEVRRGARRLRRSPTASSRGWCAASTTTSARSSRCSPAGSERRTRSSGADATTGSVEELGGPPMPGFGFAIGLERLAAAPPAERPGGRSELDVAVVAIGEEGCGRVGRDWPRRLRARGCRVVMPLAERPLGRAAEACGTPGARASRCSSARTSCSRAAIGLKDLASGRAGAVDDEARRSPALEGGTMNADARSCCTARAGCGELRTRTPRPAREVVLTGWVHRRRDLGQPDLRRAARPHRTGAGRVRSVGERRGARRGRGLRDEFVVGVRGRVVPREAPNPNHPTGRSRCGPRSSWSTTGAEHVPFPVDDDERGERRGAADPPLRRSAPPAAAGARCALRHRLASAARRGARRARVRRGRNADAHPLDPGGRARLPGAEPRASRAASTRCRSRRSCSSSC